MGKKSEEFMIEAYNVAFEQQASLSNQAKKMLWYKVRKEARGAPKKVIAQLVGLTPIPGVGAAINMSTEAVLKKLDAVRKDRKRSRYAAARSSGPNEGESLRKYAKVQAKGNKEVVEKIDRNLVKLKDAAARINNAISVFNSARSASDENIADAAWNLALRIYETQHYEEKVQYLVETMHLQLDAVSDYIASSTKMTVDLEGDLGNTLDEMEREGKEIGRLPAHAVEELDDTPLLRSGIPRSDSFRR